MADLSKRCLLLFLFSLIVCVSVFGYSKAVSAADEGISDVTVQISALGSDTSQITLSWRDVAPVNGGTITYDIEKSTDGGLTFVLCASISNTTWTDNNGGSGVANYTNVIYQLRSEETVNGTATPSPWGWPVKVFPPNINIHDNYMNNTNLCSNCHATHTAKADQLLTLNNVTSTTELCLTCHEGATNSKYDVENGYTKTSSGIACSLAGGFSHNGTGVQGDPWGGTSTVSAHNIDGTTANPAPGFGGTNASQPMTLGCTSCHTAHGTGNYRMLRTTINVPTSSDSATAYTISVAGNAETKTSSSGEDSVYLSGAETLCQSCHGDYTVGTSHPVVAAIGPLTTTLPLEGTADDRANNTMKMTCITCHYSHGSTSGNLTINSGNDLCWKCHSPAQYGVPASPDNTSSGFSNSVQPNLHNYSDAGGHLGNCSTCHITHGNNVDGLLVGPGNPITAVDGTAAAGNWQYTSCTTACHTKQTGGGA